MRNLTVDMDFLSEVARFLSPYKVRICLLGGEPGLIKNLREVVTEIQAHKNLVVQVLSNSLVRQTHPWVLEDPNIYYIEHLVLDFHEDKIEKLGKYEFLPANDLNNYNLIIKTPNYFKYRGQHDLSMVEHQNTEFKEYNSRSPEFSRSKQAPELERRICSKFPLVPVIDFEIQKIRHCSKRVIDGSKHFDVTQKNIDAMMNFELFEFESYCKTCYDIMPQRPAAHRSRVLNALGAHTQ